jgi:short-subunit dehydrogenase
MARQFLGEGHSLCKFRREKEQLVAIAAHLSKKQAFDKLVFHAT